MSATTIKSALGLLQDDPDHNAAWTELRREVGASSEMSAGELANLLDAARRAHGGRGEVEAVARLLQIEIEAEFFRHGADTVAYDSIIASGPNAAVLHHLPTQRPLRAGELVLIDAGAECRGYDCDVTRTYPVSGDFSAEQADVYALVLQAQRAAIGRCRAGARRTRPPPRRARCCQRSRRSGRRAGSTPRVSRPAPPSGSRSPSPRPRGGPSPAPSSKVVSRRFGAIAVAT